MAVTLNMISGGAAQGLVDRLRSGFAASHEVEVEGTFGAVGAMRDKLLAGAPCDVLVLTQALVDQLMADGHLAKGSARPLGVVKTGVAVKSGEMAPPIGDAASLASALRWASGIYFPDPEKATAGIHFMKVLKSLGLDPELAARFHTHPNGQAAMRAMAQSAEAGPLGCTQVTEILNTPGVHLAGLLPKEFELATGYTAAVCAKARQPKEAATLVALLAAPENAALRAQCGFEAA